MSLIDWALFTSLGLIWGSSFLWIKVALGDIGPFAVVAWRLLFGIAGLALVMLVRRRPLPQYGRLWRNLAILGLFNTALPFVLITWGELTIDSAVASVLNSTVPLFTLVIAHFALHDDRLTLQRVIGLVVGFGGVLILMTRSGGGSGMGGTVWGHLAVLIAALSYGSSAVFARRTMREVPALIQAFVPMIFADLAVWPFALSTETNGIVPQQGLAWVALLWLGLLGSCTAYLIYFSLLHRIGPTRASMVTYLIAVVGVILGVVFLGERLDVALAGGTLMVIAGIAIVNWQRRRGTVAQA